MEKTIIPKIIHYCWFGRKEIPKNAQKNIKTWKKYHPDFKFILWDENKFDIESAPKYVKEAYQSKRYAFVSDYVRLIALQKFGGIYLDTDVEVIKSFEKFLNNEAFLGFETEEMLGSGIIGTIPNHSFTKAILETYQNDSFYLTNGTKNLTPNTKRITEICVDKFGLQLNNKQQYLDCMKVEIFPIRYFCAKDIFSGKIIITKDTYSIHHFQGNWLPKHIRFRRKIRIFLGPMIANEYIKIRNFFKKKG